MSNLAERLKAGTSELHRRVERSPFMSTLLRGRLSRDAYCALLSSLRAVYAALESAIAHHRDLPLLACVLDPALARRGALEADLDLLYGTHWRAELPPAPSVAAYVHHLEHLGATDPRLLLAHAYVRYLGDLSGGQLLGRIVTDGLSLAPGSGTAFYDFGEPHQAAAMARGIRKGLADLAVDESTATALVEEARQAFLWHQRLFDELAGDWLAH